MRKTSNIIFVTIITIIIFILGPSPVFAHVLKTDGPIGAIMHIDPNDDPVALSPAYFFFEFKDKQNKFQPLDCNCTFIIKEAGSQIYSQPLFENNPNPSLSNSSVTYTFLKKDVYQITVTGSPDSPAQFQPFTLTYDIRVDKEAETNSSASPNWFYSHLYLLVGLGAVTLILIFTFAKKPLKE